jgi:hypothetical protein
MAVTLANGSAIPSFIKLQNDKINVFTNNPSNIGLYAIKFQGCYNYKPASFFQGVDIRLNTPPTLQNVSSSNLFYNFTIGQSWQVVIPQIQDNEQNSEF